MNVKKEGRYVVMALSVLTDLDHTIVSAREATQETHTTVYAHLIVLNVSIMATALLMRNVCNQGNVSARHHSSLIHWMATNAKVCPQYISVAVHL
jgi:hypothetical protein